jgi:hypothetical protein
LGNGRIKPAEIIAFPKLLIDNITVEKPEMLVMRNIPYDLIIGAYLMQRMKINLKMKGEQIEFDD